MQSKHQKLHTYIDMVIKGHTNLLTIKGTPGIGKTTFVLNQLEEAGLQENLHYVYLTGHVTPLKLFATLAKCVVMQGPKIFVFDDIDAIVSNKVSLALLKGALAEARGKRIVSYETSRNSKDEFALRNFDFTGSVIVIVNNMKQESAVGSALLDRGIFYNMELDADEIRSYVEEILPKIHKDITDEEKQSVWIKIKRFADRPNFSLRAVNRAMEFYKYTPENWYHLWYTLITR